MIHYCLTAAQPCKTAGAHKSCNSHVWGICDPKRENFFQHVYLEEMAVNSNCSGQKPH